MSLAVDTPRIVLLISGKRKCGKDYLSDALLKRIGTERAQIVRISEPIKRHWANTMKLDLGELLGDSAYKERYRQQMIEWSEEQRRRDYGIFCREACRTILREVCIVSDVRRRTDMRYFFDTYGKARIRTVRIEANDEARAVRGWHFQPGVDDVPSECDLDDYNEWDLRIANDRSSNVEDLLGQLVKLLDS
ncbi:phosphomevalonate kinase [Anopheles cruzii]|uniref:phosphomevalonate kinase n=1 Tax=Anopheles cruzii TaxID=68878 RepID=UPI0022EC65BC|nr:phosphomevalonate kinase [Anopheles cruzii]